MITENELLQELVAAYEITPLEKGEVTAKMLGLKLSVSSRQALYILTQEEIDGNLVSRQAKVNGRVVKAFRKVDK